MRRSLKDVPFAQPARAERRGALSRDYSTSGSTTTFKAGANWKPIKDLRLRGVLRRGLPGAVDRRTVRNAVALRPDDQRSVLDDSTAPRTSSTDATVRGKLHRARRSGRRQLQQANPQISVLVGGNQNLKPETSKSWIFGGVVSPSFLPGFSIEANHYNIRIKGAIQPVDAAFTLNNCVVNNDPASCALVTRASTAA